MPRIVPLAAASPREGGAAFRVHRICKEKRPEMLDEGAVACGCAAAGIDARDAEPVPTFFIP